MQKINEALERLHRAADGVESVCALAQAQQQTIEHTQVEAAHLRAEISALKKRNQQLEHDCQRAARRVEKAIEKIDAALMRNDGDTTEEGASFRLQPEH